MHGHVRALPQTVPVIAIPLGRGFDHQSVDVHGGRAVGGVVHREVDVSTAAASEVQHVGSVREQIRHALHPTIEDLTRLIRVTSEVDAVGPVVAVDEEQPKRGARVHEIERLAREREVADPRTGVEGVNATEEVPGVASDTTATLALREQLSVELLRAWAEHEQPAVHTECRDGRDQHDSREHQTPRRDCGAHEHRP